MRVTSQSDCGQSTRKKCRKNADGRHEAGHDEESESSNQCTTLMLSSRNCIGPKRVTMARFSRRSGFMHHDTDPKTGQPIGKPVDTTPARRPDVVTLKGRYGRLEKLEPHHAADLWTVLQGHDEIWTYMSTAGPFTDEKDFAALIAMRAAAQDPYAYCILDANGRAVGYLTLMEIRPEMRVVEVGHVIYSPALQRTRLGTEAQFLLARYVFETLGYRRYEWNCNALNAPSRRAALRYGFQYEGMFRQHWIAKGRNRDNTWFSMLDREWPARKAAFEQWLDPSNFTADGKQKISLAALTAPM
jgi:RimJ/RimL family protein N-acetyltransferase